VAVIGTLCSMFIRTTPPAQPDARLVMEDFVASEPIKKLLFRDRPLLLAIIVSSIFWLIGGIVMPVVNAMGKVQMALASDGAVSVLTGGLAIGIILGAVSANVLLKKMNPTTQVRLGMSIMIVSMVILGFWLPGGKPMLGYAGSLIFLVLAGIGAAVFVIPLQVFLQQRPPAELKGRMIATMNFANFVGILLAGPLYQLFLFLVSALGWPVSSVFWIMSLMLLPCALLYRLPTDSER
jgi:MFS family permease